MARHPEWFERLDAIVEVVRQADHVEWLGRTEMKVIFSCSERDSIRLLHKFGAEERSNALSLPRSDLLTQLDAVRRGPAYQSFFRQRQGVAQHLMKARDEARAHQFRAQSAATQPNNRPSFGELPETITWRRTDPAGPALFEIRYDTGEDLMWQLAEFLRVAGQNRAEFFRTTEPAP